MSTHLRSHYNARRQSHPISELLALRMLSIQGISSCLLNTRASCLSPCSEPLYVSWAMMAAPGLVLIILHWNYHGYTYIIMSVAKN